MQTLETKYEVHIIFGPIWERLGLYFQTVEEEKNELGLVF